LFKERCYPALVRLSWFKKPQNYLLIVACAGLVSWDPKFRRDFEQTGQPKVEDLREMRPYSLRVECKRNKRAGKRVRQNSGDVFLRDLWITLFCLFVCDAICVEQMLSARLQQSLP
jgi:hypothetical protein